MPKELDLLPFDATKQFIQEAYENSYKDEVSVTESEINFSKPYSFVNGQYYQAEFDVPVIKKQGLYEEVIIPSISLDEKPDGETPVGKRRPNATLLYVFASPTGVNEPYQSLEQIGNMYNVSYEQIRHDVKNNLSDLESSVEDRLRHKYPLKRLQTRRPRTLSLRIDTSLRQSDSVWKIHQMVKDGASAEDIIREYGSDRSSAARRKLKEWGLEAPDRVKKNFREIINKINDPETGREELQVLIKEFDNKGVITNYSKRTLGVLIPVSDLQQEAWGHKNHRLTKQAYDILEEAGIPVHSVEDYFQKYRQIYRLSFRRFHDQAVEVLRRFANEFSYQPVVQLGGEALSEIPTTTHLSGKKRGDWEVILTHDMGIKKTMKAKFFDLLEKDLKDNSVNYPVLGRYENGTDFKDVYVKKENKEEFVAYIRELVVRRFEA